MNCQSKKYRKVTFGIAVFLICLCVGCKDKTVDVSTGATPKILYDGSRCEYSADGVKFILESDKDNYAEGDTVHVRFTIRNERALHQTDALKVSFSTNTFGLCRTDGAEFSAEVPSLDYGEEYISETDLTVDMTTFKPAWILEKDDAVPQKSIAFDYAGTVVVIKCLADINVREVPLNLSKKEAKRQRVSCHDPSIFKDTDGTYYLVGTHITGAKSDDLINFKSIDLKLRNGFSKQTKEQVSLWSDDAKSPSWYGYLWAPDIVINEKLGKYCMYLSANGDNWVSNIVMLTSDSAEGPFEYAGTVVYGGFTTDTVRDTDVLKVLGEESLPQRYVVNGVKNRKWGDEYPNCIDPCAFYDEEGKLWMTYGSWSGGIFMLKLDENTGLRDMSVSYETNAHSDAYFGKKIAGGKYVSGEGSFIQYIDGYYYLFVSYGALEADGGYNIRVYRSRTPDGEYVDALGNSPYFDTYVQNYNKSVGVRLFGAYKWRNFENAQVSQGHNSAFTDDDGRSYIVFHTRTDNGTEYHYVKVHELFVNKEGWLVASPYEVSESKSTLGGLNKESFVGNWEIIVHNLDVNYKKKIPNTPEGITLNSDGTLEGFFAGRWSYDSQNGWFNIVLDDEEYSGVALSMKIEYTDLDTLVFTCLGLNNQITLWGSKSVE